MRQEPAGMPGSAGQQGQAARDVAIFAAGCFWGVQYYFDQVPGVIKTEAGYTGGHTNDPNWHNTHEQETGHAEALLVEFDPKRVKYETLVRNFFRLHDPTALNAADGINIGSNYRSALFYFNEAQKKTAKKVRDEIQKTLSKPIITEFSPASKFYEAEDFHQKFAERTGRGMCHIPYQPI